MPTGFAAHWSRRAIVSIAAWLVVLQAFFAGVAIAQTGAALTFDPVAAAAICHGSGGAGSDDTTPPETGKKKNRIGLEMQPYRGGKTTLCAGCGHNAISERIIEACFDLGVDAKRVLKLSGIGCSSKSPAYFLSQSHGFNSVHGRMPSVATGALLANRSMLAIGVSGDGDTGAIGIGLTAIIPSGTRTRSAIVAAPSQPCGTRSTAL